jgi:hypothetical protein
MRGDLTKSFLERLTVKAKLAQERLGRMVVSGA